MVEGGNGFHRNRLESSSRLTARSFDGQKTETIIRSGHQWSWECPMVRVLMTGDANLG